MIEITLHQDDFARASAFIYVLICLGYSEDEARDITSIDLVLEDLGFDCKVHKD